MRSYIQTFQTAAKNNGTITEHHVYRMHKKHLAAQTQFKDNYRQMYKFQCDRVATHKISPSIYSISVVQDGAGELRPEPQY